MHREAVADLFEYIEVQSTSRRQHRLTATLSFRNKPPSVDIARLAVFITQCLHPDE